MKGNDQQTPAADTKAASPTRAVFLRDEPPSTLLIIGLSLCLVSTVVKSLLDNDQSWQLAETQLPWLGKFENIARAGYSLQTIFRLIGIALISYAAARVISVALSRRLPLRRVKRPGSPRA